MSILQVLQQDRNNVKALFRKGQANVALNNQELGLDYFKKAHRLVPYDKKVISEIRKVKKNIKEYFITEKKMFVKMFKN